MIKLNLVVGKVLKSTNSQPGIQDPTLQQKPDKSTLIHVY